MRRIGRRKLLLRLIYLSLSIAILWQGGRVVLHLRTPREVEYNTYHTVHVGGHVDRPGRYRVPEGTTQFQILKTAGVRPTSDITSFNLSQQVVSDQNMDVGERQEPVSLKVSPHRARLEFYFGGVDIVSEDGRSRPDREGILIEQGDRVLTEASSQAEISLGAYSRIDIDDFSEIVFDEIGVEEEDKTVSTIFHRSGICWYKMVYTSKDERYYVLTSTANIAVAGSGADFVVDVQTDAVRIHNTDGLLLVERPDGEEAVNLIAGQTALVYNDGRPIQVRTLAADVSPNERFSQLVKEKTTYMMRFMPLNFLFCGPANTYYLISAQFDKGVTHVIRLPATTSVQQFAQGFHSLDEAFLYGGVVFVVTLVEQLMSTRVTKYCIFGKDDVIRTASSIGGIGVNVDSKAASYLGVARGRQRLSGQKLIKFMSPKVSGSQDSRERQFVAMKSLFTALRSKNIVLTALLADQIIANIETNFTSQDVMDHYNKFMSRSNWDLEFHVLPTREINIEGKAYHDPKLEQAREILVGSE